MTSWADRRSKLSHCVDMTLCWGQLTRPRFLMVLSAAAHHYPAWRSDQQQEASSLISIIAVSSVPQ